MEVSGEHERDGADPFHDGVSLRCDLECSVQTYLDKDIKPIGSLDLKWYRNVTHGQ